jgi:hypothetical protein
MVMKDYFDNGIAAKMFNSWAIYTPTSAGLPVESS